MLFATDTGGTNDGMPADQPGPHPGPRLLGQLKFPVAEAAPNHTMRAFVASWASVGHPIAAVTSSGSPLFRLPRRSVAVAAHGSSVEYRSRSADSAVTLISTRSTQRLPL